MLPGIMGRSRKCQVARRGGAETWKQELLPQFQGHPFGPVPTNLILTSLAQCLGVSITMAVLIGLKTGLGPFCQWEQFLFPISGPMTG